MKNSAFHLNLLSDTEKMSSSPIRLRVMMPILAILAVVGMMIWWGMLTAQTMLVHTKTSSIRDELASKKAAHDAIMGNMNLANEESAQLQQLEMYRGGCIRWGATFAAIAAAMPDKAQLVRLEIPEPPPQVLHDPKNPKKPPLLGPTNDTESVALVITGRAASDTTIEAFVKSLKGSAFTNRLVSAEAKAKQEAQSTLQKDDSQRLLAFEIECKATDRRFAK